MLGTIVRPVSLASWPDRGRGDCLPVFARRGRGTIWKYAARGLKAVICRRRKTSSPVSYVLLTPVFIET